MDSSNTPISTAILLAGGSGNRMAGTVEDKILAQLAGKPVVAHSIAAFLNSGQVTHLVIVTRGDAQRAAIESAIASLQATTSPSAPSPQPSASTTFATGGAERRDSVWAGLQACPVETEIVLIHDCARPCVTPDAIRESIAAAQSTGAACLARPVADTLKSVSPYGTPPSALNPQPSAYLTTTVDRTTLWAMETPQTFQYPIIRDAYEIVIQRNLPITDDLSAIEEDDQPVTFINNHRPNPKLTTPADLPYLEFLLTQQA